MTYRTRLAVVLGLILFTGLLLGLSLILALPIAALAAAALALPLSWLLVRVVAPRSPQPRVSDTPPELEDLHHLSAESFEGLIAGTFRSLGFTVDEMDYRGDTYLADFILQHEQRGEIVVAIARQLGPDKAVESTPCRQLLEAIRRFHASRGILVTTGRIPSEVRQLAAQSDEVIELIDGSLLRKMAYNAHVPPDQVAS